MNKLAIILLRVSLGAAFLSAVADRFGWFGAAGAPNVAWGNWENFEAYTAKLTFFMPVPLIPLLAIAATVAEILLGIALIAGVWPRMTAMLSAALLASFALTMTMASGIKAPLNHSVFTAAAAALLLASRYGIGIAEERMRVAAEDHAAAPRAQFDGAGRAGVGV